MMKLVGGTLASILALIGILNFINAVVTGIFSRKRELAMMNAVGMAGSQIKKMLMWEGVYYAVLTTICSACFATLLSNVVINRVARESPFFSYSFTLAPIGICVPILILMSLLIPLVSYQTICRESIVDRIREN
jgi:putative ABC transport system permease protein